MFSLEVRSCIYWKSIQGKAKQDTFLSSQRRDHKPQTIVDLTSRLKIFWILFQFVWSFRGGETKTRLQLVKEGKLRGLGINRCRWESDSSFQNLKITEWGEINSHGPVWASGEWLRWGSTSTNVTLLLRFKSTTKTRNGKSNTKILKTKLRIEDWW